MSYIEWNDDLSVEVPEMDEQHKKWVSIINELHDAMKKGIANNIMSDIMKKMLDYIEYHFSQEETLLEKVAYPERSNHHLIHKRYTQVIQKMNGDFKANKILMSLTLMNSLKEWLVSHIKGEDKKYAGYINRPH